MNKQMQSSWREEREEPKQWKTEGILLYLKFRTGRGCQRNLPPNQHVEDELPPTFTKRSRQSTTIDHVAQTPRQVGIPERSLRSPCYMCNPSEQVKPMTKQRRGKRDRQRPQSRAVLKHGADKPSGGIEALIPSLIGLAILVGAVMAKMGFRGRATVAGIDLGTTNSVICVQAPAKGVGQIDCIPDPATGSPIIPSVVSFLEASERPVGPKSKTPSLLYPHPSAVIVGTPAKRRIDSHPHHTLYNAKRVIGRSSDDPAVRDVEHEVEFAFTEDDDGALAFAVPESDRPIAPHQVGSYVVHHLMVIAQQFLGHDNVKSAVICVPAKFNDAQKMATYQAFRNAGIQVARVVEEPTAAALAYGLHRKEGVDYILVYDFGGGTLDVSLLHVSEGFVDVMGSDGDDLLGGADFDAAIATFLLTKKDGQVLVDRVSTAMKSLEKPGVDLEDALSAACPTLKETPLCTASSFHTLGEQMKIGLSSYPDGGGEVSSRCLGLPDVIPDELTLSSFCDILQPETLSLTSEEYQTSVQPLFDRSVLPVERLLHDLNLRPEEIDEVVMVGGTTRIPHVRTLVQNVLPTAQLNTHIDPDITVAYGAASVID